MLFGLGDDFLDGIAERVGGDEFDAVIAESGDAGHDAVEIGKARHGVILQVADFHGRTHTWIETGEMAACKVRFHAAFCKA